MSAIATTDPRVRRLADINRIGVHTDEAWETLDGRWVFERHTGRWDVFPDRADNPANDFGFASLDQAIEWTLGAAR